MMIIIHIMELCFGNQNVTNHRMIKITLKQNDIPSNTSYKSDAFWYLHEVLNAYLKYLTSTTCTKSNHVLFLPYCTFLILTKDKQKYFLIIGNNDLNEYS